MSRKAAIVESEKIKFFYLLVRSRLRRSVLLPKTKQQPSDTHCNLVLHKNRELEVCVLNFPWQLDN